MTTRTMVTLAIPAALGMSLVPYGVALAGAVIGQIGGPPANAVMWLALIALAGPAITAKASLRAGDDRFVPAINAVIVGVSTGILWFVAMPVRTHQGIWMGPDGSSAPFVGLIFFAGLLVANRAAMFWVRRGWTILAVLIGGATVVMAGLIAVSAAPSLPF